MKIAYVLASVLSFGCFLVACEEEPAPIAQGDGDGDGDGGDGDGDGDGDGGDGDGDGGDGDGDTPPVEVVKGERGSSCNATADCKDGLSCIVGGDCPVGVSCANKSCQPSNFDIMGTGKQCKISQCQSKDDCCGDKPQQAPSKCAGRDDICFSSTAAGCTTITCTDDSECGEGSCRGYCTANSTNRCDMDDDCPTNSCIIDPQNPAYNYCSITNTTGCVDDGDCTLNSCYTTSLYCDCVNPDYDPSNPICTDEECEGICEFSCEDEMCLLDLSCDEDEDCGALTPFCKSGECIECRDSDDCDDEECVNGRCGPECEQDTQCPLFSVCADNACEYVGCQSDRECVLSFDGDSGQDPRLSRCAIKDGIGTCVFPCEIDAQCAATEVCLNGLCEYIGCETDVECKTISGLHNEPIPTEDQPWTTTAYCQADDESP